MFAHMYMFFHIEEVKFILNVEKIKETVVSFYKYNFIVN